MRILILPALLFVMAIPSIAQLPVSWCDNEYHTNQGYYFDFSTPPDSSVYFIIPEINQPGNTWQRGTVNKPYFTSGSPGPRALVTDSINPYPANNRSSFSFTVINCQGLHPPGGYTALLLQFSYSVNADSLKDGGTVEISHNHGLSWTNAIYDTGHVMNVSGFYSGDDIISSLGKPGFTGNRKGAFAGIWFKPAYSPDADTMIFKFTFGSDSIQTNKDGWMVSSIFIRPFYEGIDEKFKPDLITIFPNPATSGVFIRIKSRLTPKSRIRLENSLGQVAGEFVADQQLMRLDPPVPGVYLVTYDDGIFYTVKKLIISRP